MIFLCNLVGILGGGAGFGGGFIFGGGGEADLTFFFGERGGDADRDGCGVGVPDDVVVVCDDDLLLGFGGGDCGGGGGDGERDPSDDGSLFRGPGLGPVHNAFLRTYTLVKLKLTFSLCTTPFFT